MSLLNYYRSTNKSALSDSVLVLINYLTEIQFSKVGTEAYKDACNQEQIRKVYNFYII
jgi:hypothetical protein